MNHTNNNSNMNAETAKEMEYQKLLREAKKEISDRRARGEKDPLDGFFEYCFGPRSPQLSNDGESIGDGDVGHSPTLNLGIGKGQNSGSITSGKYRRFGEVIYQGHENDSSRDARPILMSDQFLHDVSPSVRIAERCLLVTILLGLMVLTQFAMITLGWGWK